MRLATGLHASIWDVSLWTLDKLHCRLLDPFPRLDLSSTILSTCIRSTVLALALGVSNRKTKDVPGYKHWSDLPKNRQLACVLASVWGTDFWTLDRLQCGPFEPFAGAGSKLHIYSPHWQTEVKTLRPGLTQAKATRNWYSCVIICPNKTKLWHIKG